jgi:zinc/manganese transport system permease protein
MPGDILRYAFLRQALETGSIVAVLAAFVGFFLLARGLTFAAHALPNIGFAGAAGAVLVGVQPVYGLFAFTALAALGIGAFGEELRERDISVAVIMTLCLGLGFLFLSLYSGYAQRAYGILFGSILGVSADDVRVTALAAIPTLAALLFLYRPLLFCSVDPQGAAARGLPVRGIALLFLCLSAVVVSLSIQMMGALLVFTLLVGPSATALRLTRSPRTAILLAAALGLAYVWAGVAIAALDGRLPVSFIVATIAFLVYAPLRLGRGMAGRRSPRRRASGEGI